MPYLLSRPRTHLDSPTLITRLVRYSNINALNLAEPCLDTTILYNSSNSYPKLTLSLVCSIQNVRPQHISHGTHEGALCGLWADRNNL